MKAIFQIGFHQALTVSDLARLLGLGNSAASILVQHLVEAGLVERSEDAEDRRRTNVRLTQKGTHLVTWRHEQREAVLGRWLNQINDDQLWKMLDGLQALVQVAHRDPKKNQDQI